MPQAPLPTAEILALLRENPARMTALTANLTPGQLRTAPEPDAWSLTDILAHLRACADVWGDCIAAMLAEEHPTIRAINPRGWIKRTAYRDLAFVPSFAAFTAHREVLLSALDTLSPEQWERSATITGAGVPLTRDVRFYAQWLARHERSHLKEMARVAATVRR
jgi:hypothetical protein